MWPKIAMLTTATPHQPNFNANPVGGMVRGHSRTKGSITSADGLGLTFMVTFCPIYWLNLVDSIRNFAIFQNQIFLNSDSLWDQEL